MHEIRLIVRREFEQTRKRGKHFYVSTWTASEVEATILGIPGVREAAVIGVPHEVLGSAIKAFVVLEPGAVLDPRTIQKECRARLESFMVPTYVELRTALPKSPNGKIQKSELA